MINRLLPAFVVLAFAACKQGEGAMVVDISLGAKNPSTCVQLEVLSGTQVLRQERLARSPGKDTFRIGVNQGTFPSALSFQAKAYFSKNLCDEPRLLNGASDIKAATFEVGTVKTVSLSLSLSRDAGSDLDQDGFLSDAIGGADCLDSDPLVRPDAPERCTEPKDSNCDSRFGCQDTSCQGLPECNNPATKLAFQHLPVFPSPLVRDCSAQPLTVVPATANGVARPIPYSAPLTISVNPPVGLTLAPAGNCSANLGTLTLLGGGVTPPQAPFSFVGTEPGTYAVTVSAPGLLPATIDVTVRARPADRLAFVPASISSIAGECSSAIKLERRDSDGYPTSAPTELSSSLSNPAGLSLFEDAMCNQGVGGGTLIIPAAAASTLLYVKGTVLGSAQVTASAPGIPDAGRGVLTVNVVPGAATQLVFTTPVKSIGGGACTGAMSVQLRDMNGNPTRVDAGTPVALSVEQVSSGLTFHAGTSCSGPAISSAAFADTGTFSTATFSALATNLGQFTVKAEAAGLSATQTVSVGAGAPYRLVFTPSTLSTQAGGCDLATFQLRDDAGYPTGAVSPQNVTLGPVPAPSGLGFFTDNLCTNANATATLAVGETEGSVYVRNTVAGSLNVTANSLGVIPGTLSLTTAAGPQSTLIFSTPARNVSAGSCSAFLRVRRQDNFGNVVAPATATAMNLLSNADGGLTFHSTAACAMPVFTTATIPAGASETIFHFRALKAGPVELRVQNISAPSQVAVQTQQVDAGNPTQLVIVDGGNINQPALDCSAAPVVFQLRDIGGNVAPWVAAPGNVTFSAPGVALSYSNSGTCSPTLSSIPLTSGTSAGSFYVRGLDAGSGNLTLSAPGGLSTSTPVTFSSPRVQGLRVAVGRARSEAGFCTGMTVQALDGTDGGVSVSAPLVVTLSSSGAGAVFYADSNCQTPLPSNQTTIPMGSASSQVFVRSITAVGSPFTLTGTAMPPSTTVQGSVVWTVLPMVRSGSCTISTGQQNNRCPLSPQLSTLSRTFMVFASTIDQDNPNRTDVSCRLETIAADGGAQVYCARAQTSASTSASVQWQTVSFPYGVDAGGVTVTHVDPFDILNPFPSVPVAVPLGHTVAPSSSFVLFSSRVDTNDQRSLAFHTASLADGGSGVDIATMESSNFAANAVVNIQVVQMAGARVDHMSPVILGVGSTTSSITGLQVSAPERTIVLSSTRQGLGPNDDARMCKRLVRASMPSSSAVDFTRGNGSGASACSDLEAHAVAQRIEFPAGRAAVIPLNVSMADGASSTTLTLGRTVDPTRTIILASGQGPSGQSLGESADSSTTGKLGVALGRATGAGTWVREVTQESAAWTLFAVEFSP